jgi:hypothetical protein
VKTTRILALTIVALAFAAPAVAGGFGLGAQIYDGDFGIQARKDFAMGGDIGGFTGQAGIVFAYSEVFTLDADYHFLFSKDKTRFYGLVGPQLAFNSDFTEFGVNAGAGLNFMMTDTKAAFAEAKIVLISDYDGFVATVGLYF